MEKHHFSPGQVIFSEGDASDEAYVVRSGRVEILKESSAGPVRLAVLGEGDVFGEMGLLEDRPRSASARASQAVVADAIGRAEFLRLLLHEPHEALGLLRALFERLRTMNQMVVDSGPPEPQGARIPRVRLLPLSAETRAALPEAGVRVTRFPFRVGRVPESREEDVLAFNDVRLRDARPHTVSLNHFALDLGPSGVVVRDRGSRKGTLVNGARIGPREARDDAPLRAGDNDVVAGAPRSDFGAALSPFRFKVIVEPG
ncbi:MAG: cyclic nucleotide-binding domain-containing protein [Kiloniellaceae bacterium]